MKQLVPTSIDEYIAEHKPGDVVSGRVVEVVGRPATVELGEGIRGTCVLRPAAPAAPIGYRSHRAAKRADLSSLSSMLQARWKGNAPAASIQAGAAERRPDSQLQDREARCGSEEDRSGVGVGLQIRLVDIAPAPVFAALGRLDQRVLRGMKVRARVTVLRRVAATHVAALQAHAQVNPRVAGLQALFAALGLRLHFLQVLRQHDCNPLAAIVTSV